MKPVVDVLVQSIRRGDHEGNKLKRLSKTWNQSAQDFQELK